MIKYLTIEEGQQRYFYGDGLATQNILSVYGAVNYPLQFTGTDYIMIDMEDRLETSDFKLSGNYVSVSNPYWQMFTDDANGRADIGELNCERNFTLQFKRRKYAVVAIALDMIISEVPDIYADETFDMYVYASNDGDRWQPLGKINSTVAGRVDAESFIYRRADSTEHNHSLDNPSIFFRLDNIEPYNYYKLSFVSNLSFFQHISLSIRSLRLYDAVALASGIHNFPLREDSSDVNGWHNGVDLGVEYGVLGNRLCARLGNGGKSSSISYSPTLAYGMGDNFSCSIFVWVDAGLTVGSILSKSKDNFNVELQADGDEHYILWIKVRSAIKSIIFPKSAVLGNWHNLTITYRGKWIDVYWDGLPLSGFEYTGDKNNDLSKVFNVGCETIGDGRGNHFRGGIRNLMVYDYPLHESQVRYIYQILQ